jgi:hypothetical protein
MSNIIRLIDRTRTVADWKCPRSRWWGYEYLGKGIVKSGTSLALFTGIVVHDAMAAIATFTKEAEGDDPLGAVPIDDIANAAFTQVRDNILESAGPVVLPETTEFANEQGALTEGLIRGFFKHLWPKLYEQYPRIIAIEQEMEYTLDDLTTFMTKPDLIVENQEGDLVYLEYKTTSNKKENWIKSWETAVQLHSSIKATEATLGKLPSYVQIVGLYKGYESYGKQSSPFCYAYIKKGNPPFSQDQVQYEYKAGFRRYPTWELPGGVKAWVESMPENVLTNQFPLTPPIFVNEDLVNKFFNQRLLREREIADHLNLHGFQDIMLDKVFPQHFDQCNPSYGWSCPYSKLCHGEVKDPLQEGYEFRVPHHARELENE